MELNIKLNEDIIKKLIAEYVSDAVNADFTKNEIKIEFKSRSSEDWQIGQVRAVAEKVVEDLE